MRWDPIRRRYIDPKGRVIPPAQIREWIEDYIEAEKESIGRRADGLIDGAVLVYEFFQWLREEVKVMHSTAAVVAYGGEDEMTAKRWGRVGSKILSEYQYLSEFQKVVPLVPENAPRDRLAELFTPIKPRAQMYGDSVYGTYENSVKARESDNGVIRGRRILEAGVDHCDDCPLLASEDYRTLDELADIGDSQCGPRCRCKIEFEYLNVEPLSIPREIYAGV